MEQSWFEMHEVRRRKLDGNVWIPLRAIQDLRKEGESGFAGYVSEFFGVGSVALPVEAKNDESCTHYLQWMNVGPKHPSTVYVEKGEYYSADHFDCGEQIGVNLVLEQHANSVDLTEWYLHQDLVIAFGLRREGDVWVRPDEGYVQVARLTRDEKGSPCLIEIRAAHLKDYLCARGMALFVTSFRERTEIVGDASFISWPDGGIEDKSGMDRWEFSVKAIHEGGMPYGGEWHVLHMSRVDSKADVDVPEIGLNDESTSDSHTVKNDRPKLFRINGAFWRDEWIEPGTQVRLFDETERHHRFLS